MLAGCCRKVIQSNKKRGSARQYYLLDTNDHELKSLAPDSMQSWYQLNPLSAVDVAENWQQYRMASFDRAVEVANISATGCMEASNIRDSESNKDIDETPLELPRFH